MPITDIHHDLRLAEALASLRDKPVPSTTLERLRLTWEADQHVQGLPQPLQLGRGLTFILERIAFPVAPHDLLLGRIAEEVPDADGEAFFQRVVAGWRNRGIPPWMPDGGHETLAWEPLLRLGLSGLEAFARGELAQREAAGASAARLDWLRGAVLIYQALRTYARRYAAAAQEAGLAEPAAHCEAIAARAPQTFAEALQLLWLVGHVYCTMSSVNPTLTFGRVDELLLDYYQRDLAAGRLTRAQAGELIGDFYAKNNLILGRGEHQMSGGAEHDTGWQRNLTYDAPQYIVLGGQRARGAPSTNDLTALFLERIVPRYENPVVVLRYTPDWPAELWRLACDKLRANASVLVYSDETVIPALTACGISPADAMTYTMHGCNWPDIPGIQHALGDHSPWLPTYLLTALLGTPEQPAPDYASLDEIYARFAALFRADLEARCAQLRQNMAQWSEDDPGLLHVDDCFYDGPIAQARSWQCGGTKYPTMICAPCGLASAADSFAALDELVFRGQQVSLGDLRDALRNNFAGQEPLRQLCRNANKFGEDDARADAHAVRVLQTALDEIAAASALGTPQQLIITPCLTTNMWHVRAGATVGATPDGRLAGQPFSENTSPTPGAARKGLTAMLRSLAKLPLRRITSGALNLRLSPRLVVGEAGLTRLAALLRTYLEMGGLQVQVSLADTEELRQAQAHPEAHRDLMVRITGYSAVFVDMARTAQDEIIRREELGTG
jgi:formate C-acetyltransferase